MKNLSFMFVAAAALLAACSTDVEETLQPDEGRTAHTCEMRLEGTFQSFDAEPESLGGDAATRAAIAWAEGDSLYLQLQSSSGVVDGLAIYKGGEWKVNYYGAIASGITTACKVYRFKSPTASTASTLTLGAQTAVWGDTGATYLLQNGVLTITAQLKPLTARLRFKGYAGQKVNVSGLKWYSAYALTGALTLQSGSVALSVGSKGYTPYVYAVFADASARELSVDIDEDYYCIKHFADNVLAVGTSGYITAPTMDERNGWTLVTIPNELSFTVSGVTFKMKRVKAGSFSMGSKEQNSAQPIHTVTLTKSYYIGETEVTNALYKAVMGSTPSNMNTGNNYPVEKVSWETITTASTGFLAKLNTLASSQLGGKLFRLPTEAEWEYAARGGHKQSTPNYTYAGSNTIGDVAWYIDNSNTTTHPVAQKKANELGLYDMSGNMREWCQDWYDANYYSSSPATDPTGPTSGSYRVIRGGCWYDNAARCQVAFHDGLKPSSADVLDGFRLAL